MLIIIYKVARYAAKLSALLSAATQLVQPLLPVLKAYIKYAFTHYVLAYNPNYKQAGTVCEMLIKTESSD